MTRYTNIKMRISEDKNPSSRKHFNLIASLSQFSSDQHREDVIALTNSQLVRLVQAYKEKKGMTIKM